MLRAVDPFLPGRHRQIGQFFFGLQHFIDFFFKSALGDKPVHLYVAMLSDPEGTVGGLGFYGGVPPEVVVDHVGGGGEVEARTAGFEREEQDTRAVVVLEILDHPVARRWGKAGSAAGFCKILPPFKFAPCKSAPVKSVSFKTGWPFQRIPAASGAHFSPDLFILGGGESKFFEQYKHQITTEAKVVPARLLNNAGIIGAAAYAAESE